MALPGPSSSSPRLDFSTLNVTNIIDEYSYTPSANYTTASPGRPYTPPDNGISPLAVYNLGGGELSSLLAGAAAGVVLTLLLPSTAFHTRLFPDLIASIPSRHLLLVRRQRPREESPAMMIPTRTMMSSSPRSRLETTDVRHETIRRQRIELEQRRRDELRHGYRRLKDALPIQPEVKQGFPP